MAQNHQILIVKTHNTTLVEYALEAAILFTLHKLGTNSTIAYFMHLNQKIKVFIAGFILKILILAKSSVRLYIFRRHRYILQVQRRS